MNKSLRCDVCSRFRKSKLIVGVGGENNEEWTECVYCMSQCDLEIYFPGKTREELLNSTKDASK